jgi:hypothetical protein
VQEHSGVGWLALDNDDDDNDDDNDDYYGVGRL